MRMRVIRIGMERRMGEREWVRGRGDEGRKVNEMTVKQLDTE